MAIYVYSIQDGSLYSWCPNDTDPVATPAQLAANGLASKSGLPALSPTIGWNPATQSTTTVSIVVTGPAPPVSGTIVFNGVTYTVSGTTQ